MRRLTGGERSNETTVVRRAHPAEVGEDTGRPDAERITKKSRTAFSDAVSQRSTR